MLQKKTKLSSIPSLRDDTGHWHMDSETKANIFASTWDAKNVLPPCITEQYAGDPPQKMQTDVHMTIRTRFVRKLLSQLDENKATGPYEIGANRILKNLADELSLPIAILCRRILHEACWPTRWKLHNLRSIFKRNSVYQAKNYRGIHITCNISKIAEKVIGNPLIAYLQQFGFGDSQWASGHSDQTQAREVC